MNSEILEKFPLPDYVVSALIIEGYTDFASFQCITDVDDFINAITLTVDNKIKEFSDFTCQKSFQIVRIFSEQTKLTKKIVDVAKRDFFRAGYKSEDYRLLHGVIGKLKKIILFCADKDAVPDSTVSPEIDPSPSTSAIPSNEIVLENVFDDTDIEEPSSSEIIEAFVADSEIIPQCQEIDEEDPK